MAKRPAKTPAKPVKKAPSKKLSQEDEDAAQLAIAQVEEEYQTPEERDLSHALTDLNSLSEEELDERDVFTDAKAKAIARNSSAKFRIYRDGAWIATKTGSYSWEKLRDDFKQGGYFKVVAVDRDNQWLSSQSLEVAGVETDSPSAPAPVAIENNSVSPLTQLEMMKENQREAEAKAQAQQLGNAQIMASMVQMQTQSMQMIMQSSQKAAEQTQQLLIAFMTKKEEPKTDPILTALLSLVTSSLTQKPKGDELSSTQLVKMLEDAKRDERTKIREDDRRYDEKLKRQLEEMAPSGDGEESLTKTVIKTLGPVVADLMAKNQQQQAAQQQQVLASERARIAQAGFVEPQRDTETRPAIPAARPVPSQPSAPRAPQPVQRAAPVRDVSPAQNAQRTTQDAPSGPVPAPEAQAPVLDDRLKEQIFTMCMTDIGNALLNRLPASKTAALCLAKLEKENISRQTVKAAYTVEDFYGYADQLGLPAETKPWLKEFHEAIQKQASPRTAGAPANPGAAQRNGAAGKPIPVPASGSQGTTQSPGVQPREHAESL